MTDFNPLFVTPEWFKEYYTKYPHGLSVLENLIEWVNQTNELIEYVNISPDKAYDILSTWKADGTLQELINTLVMEEKVSVGVDYLTEDNTNLKSFWRLQEETRQSRVERLATNTLRVATFNILTARFLQPTLLHLAHRKILESKADVVGLNEIINGQFFSFSDNFENMLFPNTRFSPCHSNHWGVNGFGNAIISNPTITENSAALFAIQQNAADPKGYQRTVINYNGNDYALYVVHLATDGVVVQSQINELYSIVTSDVKAHRIVAGDFNAVNLAWFDQFTNIGFTLANNGQYLTGKTNNNPIDNIIVSPTLELLSHGMVLSGEASDHNLLWADIRIKGGV